MYVAVKGGETAIDNAHRLLAVERRGDLTVAELSVAQIREQLTLAVDRVMTEGSLTTLIWRPSPSNRRAAICWRRSSFCAPTARPCRAWPKAGSTPANACPPPYFGDL